MRKLLALALCLLATDASARGITGTRETRGGQTRAVGDTDTIPTVPGEDIFGFTSPTDPGDPGTFTYTSENDGRVGKRGGSFASVTSKNELGYTVNNRFWAAFALFGTGTRVHNLPDIGPNRTRVDFDGVSAEAQYVLLPRADVYPFQVAVDLEGGFSRLDPYSAERDPTFYITPKVFVDAVVIPDKLFWAFNFSYQPSGERTPTGLIGGSQLNATTALAYAVTPNVFLGAEARYFDSFADTALRKFAGDALFVGPTLLWKITEDLAVNVTYQPQVYGRTKGDRTRIDTSLFERQTFRLKIAYEFGT